MNKQSRIDFFNEAMIQVEAWGHCLVSTYIINYSNQYAKFSNCLTILFINIRTDINVYVIINAMLQVKLLFEFDSDFWYYILLKFEDTIWVIN